MAVYATHKNMSFVAEVALSVFHANLGVLYTQIFVLIQPH